MSGHAHRIRHWLRRPATARPAWQRVLYPLLGLLLVAIGMIGWLMPVIPGFFLIPLGIPLLFCFNPRREDAAKRAMRRCWLGWRRALHAMRPGRYPSVRRVSLRSGRQDAAQGVSPG